MGGTFSEENEPTTVGPIDLNRYAGLWYEIARIPSYFERGDQNVTAEYTVEGKRLRLVNTSIRDGEIKTISGYATPTDLYNSKLKVKFDPVFIPEGNYWIIRCAPDYSYAVVSDPGRDYLWILYRNKKMPLELYNSIIFSLQTEDFDVSKIEKTVQN